MKKKIFFTTAMTMALGVTLASCGQVSNGSSDSSATSNQNSQTTITPVEDETLTSVYNELKNGKSVKFDFWHSFGDAVSAPLIELVENFESEMTDKGFNIDVNIVNKGGGYDGLRSAVNLGADSGSIPTLVLGYPDHFADYIKQNLLLPLDSYVYNTNPDIALEGVTTTSNDFVKSYWEETQMLIEGKTSVAGIPFNKSTEIMYYNSNVIDPILESKGWLSEKGTWDNPTWEQLFEVSQYIVSNKSTISYTHNGGTYSVDKDMKYPVYVDSQSNFFITTSRQWGGTGKYTMINNDGVGVVTAYNKSNYEAQTYFLNQAKNNLFQFPQAGGTGSYGSSYMAVRKAFISIGSTAGVKNNDSKNYELKTTTVPQKGYGATDTQAVIQQGTNLAILSKASDNYQMMAAWLLTKYLSNVENQVFFSTSTGYLPVRNSARESADFKRLLDCASWDLSKLTNADDKMFYLQNSAVSKGINSAIAEIDYYYTDPAFNGSSVVRDNLETCVNDMYLYNKTFDQAMTAFYNELAKSRIKLEKNMD